MLTAEARKQVMDRITSDEHDDLAAVNALLASAFYLKGLVPVTARGRHQFTPEGHTYDEWPGSLRGKHGWLQAPRYMSSIDDACELVKCALGDGWIVETQVRADGSTAQLHEFPVPCRKTKIWRSAPGPRGAAAAIVRAVLEATEA